MLQRGYIHACGFGDLVSAEHFSERGEDLSRRGVVVLRVDGVGFIGDDGDVEDAAAWEEGVVVEGLPYCVGAFGRGKRGGRVRSIRPGRFGPVRIGGISWCICSFRRFGWRFSFRLVARGYNWIYPDWRTPTEKVKMAQAASIQLPSALSMFTPSAEFVMFLTIVFRCRRVSFVFRNSRAWPWMKNLKPL